MADPVHRSWRTEALKLAFHAFAIFPLISGKETLGVLVLYANEGEAFIEQELENGRILAEEITRKLG
jgi:signal transduction protein with GAF and PtsI domain